MRQLNLTGTVMIQNRDGTNKRALTAGTITIAFWGPINPTYQGLGSTCGRTDANGRYSIQVTDALTDPPGINLQAKATQVFDSNMAPQDIVDNGAVVEPYEASAANPFAVQLGTVIVEPPAPAPPPPPPGGG